MPDARSRRALRSRPPSADRAGTAPQRASRRPAGSSPSNPARRPPSRPVSPTARPAAGRSAMSCPPRSAGSLHRPVRAPTPRPEQRSRRRRRRQRAESAVTSNLHAGGTHRRVLRPPAEKGSTMHPTSGAALGASCPRPAAGAAVHRHRGPRSGMPIPAQVPRWTLDHPRRHGATRPAPPLRMRRTLTAPASTLPSATFHELSSDPWALA